MQPRYCPAENRCFATTALSKELRELPPDASEDVRERIASVAIIAASRSIPDAPCNTCPRIVGVEIDFGNTQNPGF